MKPHTSVTPPAAQGLLIVGILLIAANLRAPVTGVGTVLADIQRSFGFNATQAGVLATLPLLAFALVSPLAAGLARRHGLERTLFGALLLLTTGIVVRSSGTAWGLFGGTVILGSAIALCNVLLPSLLKRDFAAKVSTMTSLYAVTMSVSAALCSAVMIPLAGLSSYGWTFALGIWAVLAAFGAAAWLPQLRSATRPALQAAASPAIPIWRSPLAWQVTAFMGLNSFVYYVVISWLPAILQHNGYSAASAGSLHGLLQLATVVPGVLAVPLIHRLTDQRAAAFLSASLAVVGLAGFIALPGWSVVWCIVYGFGSSACLILALTFMSLRAGSVHQAAALSGMAQAVGYLLAAVGPTLVGALYDTFGGWSAALLLCATISAIQAVFGLYAGRPTQIGALSPGAVEPAPELAVRRR
ncbi:CynX/NimT family MFS transporter [Aromatoleum anaerobium]|uniref:MFS transporter n=1 Tax=Aromatoleum anaerobium TaxID=182180 RepID=A0ABX1PJI1_9RHOO|nr:CynX/NimT family MFS transporter [Aromatoleum anaerobium]MCK0507191.1 CynX/NimT family MFS transporter [Aromatoleum anaerobium]